MVNVSVDCCRVCLNKKIIENEIWRSITEIDDYDNDLKISDKIQLLTGIKPDISSGLAQLICQHCIINLKIAYDFRIICRNNEEIISNFLLQCNEHIQQNETKINEQTEIKQFDSNKKSNVLSKEIVKETFLLENAYSEVKVEVTDYGTEESEFCSSKDEEYSSYEKFLFDNDILPDSDNSIYQLLQKPVPKIKNKCEVGSKSQFKKRKLPKYSKSTSDEKNFVCELCGNVYKKRALLTDHMRWHSGSKDFKCEICGKAFLLNTYLARHIRTHTGIRNYKCNFCSRTFYSNGLKRAHEKVHTGERCYKCELCQRTFSYSQSLQRHMMVHSGVKPHKCEDCGKEFRQESHLKQHMATSIHQAKQQQYQKFKLQDVLEYKEELQNPI